MASFSRMMAATTCSFTAVERAGMHGLNEGDKISYDIEEDRQRGKSSAVNLQTK